MKLDAVVEIAVDEEALVDADREAGRGNRRRPGPTTMRRRSRSGSTVYREQTAPLADYYRRKGTLRSVDGMGTMDEVAAAIEGDA